MSVTAYNRGFEAGRDGKPYYHFRRNNRPYDSENDRRSYENGYCHGAKLRKEDLDERTKQKAVFKNNS